MKIVIDLNIMLSAFLWGGKPRQIIDILEQDKARNACSDILLKKLLEVLSRDKFSAKFTEGKVTPAEIIKRIQEFSEIVEPQTVPDVCRDPQDNHVLACAITAQAICIVSGDSDLLDLETHEGIQIMTAAEFLELIERRSE